MHDVNLLAKFLGHWRLDPERSSYEGGQVPASATYSIRMEGQSLIFESRWTDNHGRNYGMGFAGVPDGIDRACENRLVADTLSLILVDSGELNSTAKRAGRQIAFARRCLIAPDRLSIEQTNWLPNGEAVVNKSEYVRDRLTKSGSRSA